MLAGGDKPDPLNPCEGFAAPFSGGTPTFPDKLKYLFKLSE
jgi:hypothetical protein